MLSNKILMVKPVTVYYDKSVVQSLYLPKAVFENLQKLYFHTKVLVTMFNVLYKNKIIINVR